VSANIAGCEIAFSGEIFDSGSIMCSNPPAFERGSYATTPTHEPSA
jgi:hypothetical protein